MADRTSAWPALLSMLQQNNEQAERTMRKWHVGMQITTGVLYLATAGVIIWAFIELRNAWRGGSWDDFWSALKNWPFFGLLGAPLPSIVKFYQSCCDKTRELREAAIRGDEEEAPLAQEQPRASVGDTILFGEVRYGPLNPPKDMRGTGKGLLSFAALGACFLAGIGTLILAVTEADTPLVLIAGSLAVLFLLLAIWLMVLSGMQRRPIIVTATDMGIAWKVAGRRTQIRHIAWHNAQAFFVMTHPQSSNRAHGATWTLIGPDATLVWVSSAQEMSLHGNTQHAQFAALVAARTRLPLRDLSTLAEKVAREQAETEKRLAHPLSTSAGTEAETHADTSEMLHAAPARNARLGCRDLGLGCIIQLVLMLAILLLYAGGWGLQQYQSHYYAGLWQEIHTEKPLYHDHLGSDNGDWPVRTSTNDAPRSFSYSNDSYHMTSTAGKFVAGWTSDMYGSVAVEATVRQIGSVQNGGVGLILHTYDDNTDMTVFFIDPTDGTWSLSHFRDVSDSASENWRDLDDGSSRSIHAEAGAANHLLVIMAGDRYLCYINGSLVMSYDDNGHVTPRTGHVGLYLNDGAVEGVFNDFTVYPAPPPLPFSTI